MGQKFKKKVTVWRNGDQTTVNAWLGIGVEVPSSLGECRLDSIPCPLTITHSQHNATTHEHDIHDSLLNSPLADSLLVACGKRSVRTRNDGLDVLSYRRLHDLRCLGWRFCLEFV